MIFNTDLPKSLWPHAISYSCHIKNHSLTHALKGSSPFEQFYGKKPDLSSIQNFGCDVWVLNQGAKGKLNPRSNKYIFIGLSDDTRTYWYYKPGNGEVAKSQNVIFPCSTNSSISIPFPSQPEGENGHGNLQAAQETLDGEVDLMPKDCAVDSTNVELIPSNRATHSIDPIQPPDNIAPDPLQFLQIQTHAQSQATNSPLVQIRSDHGSTQTEKQIMPCTLQALEN